MPAIKEKSESPFDRDVDPDEIQRKALGGYGGDTGEDVILGASKEPLEGESEEGERDAKQEE